MSTKSIQLHLASFGKDAPAILFAMSKEGERWFEVPAGIREPEDHPSLFAIRKVKLNAVQCAQSSFEDSFRRFTVTVTEAIYGEYIDEQGDFYMNGVHLKELNYDFRPKRSATEVAAKAIESQIETLLDLMLKKKALEESGESSCDRKDTNPKLLNLLINMKQEREAPERADFVKTHLTGDNLNWYATCALNLNGDEWLDWRSTFVEASCGDPLVSGANDKEVPEICRSNMVVYDPLKDVQEKSDQKKLINANEPVVESDVMNDDYVKIWAETGLSKRKQAIIRCWAWTMENARTEPFHLDSTGEKPRTDRLSLIIYDSPSEEQEDELDRKKATISMSGLIADLDATGGDRTMKTNREIYLSELDLLSKRLNADADTLASISEPFDNG